MPPTPVTTLVPVAQAMIRGNIQRDGFYDDKGVPSLTGVKWKFKTGGAIRSSPAIFDGIIYIGSTDGRFYAVDIETGEEKWSFISGTVQSSAAISGGLVYFGSNDSHVYALDSVTGVERWRFRTGSAVPSSPLVLDGVVFLGSQDGRLYALDANTGVDGVVFIGGGDGQVYAVDVATGKAKWKFGRGGSQSDSSPAVAHGIVYIGLHVEEANIAGGFYALDANTGNELWRFITETEKEAFFSPSIGGELVYVGGNRQLYALDRKTGEPKWSFETKGAVASSPTVINGVVYFSSTDGYLYALH